MMIVKCMFRRGGGRFLHAFRRRSISQFEIHPREHEDTSLLQFPRANKHGERV